MRLNFLIIVRIFDDNWAFKSVKTRLIKSILVEWRIFKDKEVNSKSAAFFRLRQYVKLSSI